jgi:Toprim domain
MLALKSVLPMLPVIAGLSANNLAALDLSPAPGSGPGQGLRRLYIARDNDLAGIKAAERLREPARGLEIRDLVPVLADFNLDLCRLGADGMRRHLAAQLARMPVIVPSSEVTAARRAGHSSSGALSPAR